MSGRYWFPKHYADEVQRLRVPCGFVLVALFAWLADPTARSLAAGLPIAAVGLAIRAWASGHLAKNQQLASSGPYAHVRNPLYAGTLTVAAGLAIASRSVTLAVVMAAVFALVYLPAIELEEQHLHSLFPGFAAYTNEVPMLVPRLRAPTSSGRFSASLYWRNREYQALLGFAAGVVYLAWKAGLLR